MDHATLRSSPLRISTVSGGGTKLATARATLSTLSMGTDQLAGRREGSSLPVLR